ncbi:hypothetical protein D3C73_1289170 [compost metagenome]
MGHVTIRATRTHARAVGVVDGVLQFDKHVIAHLVAGNAEFLGVRQFQCRVESPPENDPGDKTAQCQKTQAEIHTRPTQDAPVVLKQGEQCFHGASSRFLRGVGVVLQDFVDGLEAVAHQRQHIFLRHMALVAEVATR